MKLPAIFASLFIFSFIPASKAVNKEVKIPADLSYKIEVVTFNANRACAELIGLDYSTKEFTSYDWDNYQNCMTYFRSIDGVVD